MSGELIRVKGRNMMKIDLITGFPRIREDNIYKIYASYLLKKGMNIGILKMISRAGRCGYGCCFQDLMGDNCELRWFPVAVTQTVADMRF